MRLLRIEPAAVGTTAAAVYAAVVMIYGGITGHEVLRPDVLEAAVGAVWGLWTRSQVTPLIRPRDASGAPLDRYPGPIPARRVGNDPQS